jgi:hypothetical protein
MAPGSVLRPLCPLHNNPSMSSTVVDRRYSSKLEWVSVESLPGLRIGLERPKGCHDCHLSSISSFAFDHFPSILAA